MLQQLPHTQSRKPTHIAQSNLNQQTPQYDNLQQNHQLQPSPQDTPTEDNKLQSTKQNHQVINNQTFQLNSKNQSTKPQHTQTFAKNLLAQRPSNQQHQSHQKIPPIPQQTSQKPTNKTSQNFYVTTSKKLQKRKSSPKIFLTKITSPQSKQQGLSLIDTKNQQINDITVLILIHKVVQIMRKRGDDMTLECLINEEKLIHISMAFLEKKIVSREQLDTYFSLQKEIISFVQKINKVMMENFKDEDHNVDIKIFSKAVDLLMTPNMNRFVKDLKTLGKIKVLTFNNLACIYKKKKKFGIALRSVSFALQIQQALLNQQTNEQKYDIIPTYLNKAAILSQMKKHQKAIQQIMKSQKFIQKIQKQVIKQITQAEANENQQLKKRLQQKRYYGLYMKMIINYNMGAEKEHMKMIEPACEYYKQGRQLALMINNEFMMKKFQNILNKLMETRKK